MNSFTLNNIVPVCYSSKVWPIIAGWVLSFSEIFSGGGGGAQLTTYVQPFSWKILDQPLIRFDQSLGIISCLIFCRTIIS